jgi:phosphoenolpyruvate carboxykinase (ATP)
VVDWLLKKGGGVYDRAVHPSSHGLDTIGLTHRGTAFWNLRPPALIGESLRRGESALEAGGALIARTGKHTGRAPKDKFVVKEPSSAEHIAWGDVNRPMSPEQFAGVRKRMFEYLAKRDLFVQDLYAGAHPDHRLKVRIITQLAWHSLFARQLFIRPPLEATASHKPEFTVISAPGFSADPAIDGTQSGTFILMNFAEKLVLIGGTAYAGEIKKSIFTVMNYLLPLRGVVSMHCSANVGNEGDVALFFGLSGTGKTTLSADPNRGLIGDDEHGWSDDGVFNIEGGCYAKVIRLSPQDEPEIYGALKFGSVLENVVVDPNTGERLLDDDSVTENTRGAYPLNYISHAVDPSIAGHPRNVIFLTCDAFGVLPPISRLTPEQAMYHFLSGYTAKVAGTEAGVGNEPQATFSTCFGAPFLPLDPSRYANLLGEHIARHKSSVWLVNTGWSGGPFGVGKRMRIGHTRAMITAALTGKLHDAPHGPQRCPDVPAEVLNPRNTWADKDAYDHKAAELAQRFEKNFARFESAPSEVRGAGPRVD